MIPAPNPILDVPPQMIVEVATGMEDPAEIASRYGFDEVQWAKLAQFKPFLDAVARTRVELEQSGYTFRLKQAWKADQLSDHLFQLALLSDATFMQKLEALKFFVKTGDLEPKPALSAGGNEKFSITFVIGERKDEKTVSGEVIEGEKAKKSFADRLPSFLRGEKVEELALDSPI